MDAGDVVLKPSEVASELKVDRKTVINWITSRKLYGFRVNTHWRTTRLSVDQFLNKPAEKSPRKKRDKSIKDDCLAEFRKVKASRR